MLGSLIVAMFVLQPPAPAPATTQQAPSAVAEKTAEKKWPPEGVYRVKEATAPRVVREVKPGYVSQAMQARIEGVVVLEAIVEKDGKVGEVRVKQSLDREHGLDDEAVKALKKWQFTPGMKDGAAVPVLVEIEFTFTLRQ